MTRLEANLKIAEILKNTAWDSEAKQFEELARKYPQQRAGQIMCNYMMPDYRDSNPCKETMMMRDFFFLGNPDPFFEESEVTLKRLISQ